jgi:predicted pPIWI-associating nuclease
MARRVTPQQFQSLIRQQQSKVNQAVRNYNSARQRVINEYNREVRGYNARLRANQQRLNYELSRLRQQAVAPRVVTFRTSVQALHRTFVRLETRISQSPTPFGEQFLDLSERETANSVAVLNALSGQEPEVAEAESSLQATVITSELNTLSAGLDARWRGALFALSPRNPDAARHFCASAREIFTQVIDLNASDADVLSTFPMCDKSDHGCPTRRSKVKLLLHRKNLLDQSFEDFTSQDVENIIDLFRVFNDGTHGSAGRFASNELVAVKRRVEDGILFLASIAR